MGNRMSLCLGITIVLLPIAWFVFEAFRPATDQDPRAPTIDSLQHWGIAIMIASENEPDFDVTRYQSADDLFDFLLTKKHLETYEWMRRDAWGNAFILLHVTERRLKRVKLVSKGPNGVFDHCTIDDIWVEVTLGDNPVTIGSDKRLSNLQDRRPRQ